MAYNSAYKGSEIDAAVGAVKNKETVWDAKQDALSGTNDQLVGFNEAGEAVPVWKPTAEDIGAIPAPAGGQAGQVLTKTATGEQWDDVPSDLPAGGTSGQILTKTASGVAWSDAPDTGVTTFNGRTGAVTPQAGDYTAEMVGARPSTWTPSAADVGAVPTTRTVNGQALSADISLTASDVGARASTWTPTASDVGAVPTSRTVNGKALSSNITLTADDVNAASPPTSTTVTLTTSGWTQSGDRYSQTVNCSIVAADTPVVVVDVALSGTDLDADNEALSAWAGPSANNVTQGAGTLTFYSVEAPTVNIPVNVGVG